MCVYTGYTIYKTAATDENTRSKEAEWWKLADCDTYDLDEEIYNGSQSFKEVRADPITFLNASDAHAAVADSYRRRRNGDVDTPIFHNNSHYHINEFVYHTLTMSCVGDKCGGDGTSILLFDGRPMCCTCYPDQRRREAAGTPIEPPQVLRLDGLTNCPEPLGEPKRTMVAEEYVTFMHPSILPFVRGDMSGDADLSRQIMSSCLSLVYDIETVNVNRENKKIPDKMVTITAAVCKGQRITRLMMLSIDKPDGWGYTTDETPKMKTGRLLKGLCNTKNLPDLSLIKCADESEMVNSFETVFVSINGHLLVHYNGENFDSPFVIRASVALELEGKTKNVRSGTVDR